jgi:stromal membrane-associated protein
VPPSNINKPTPTIPQQQKQQPSASLIGLDFSSPISAAPAPAPGARPTPTASGVTPAQNSRPDLKKSILSLYAAAPTPQPVYNPPQQLQHNFNNGINNLTSLTGNLSINNNTSINNNGFNTNSSFASPTATKPAAKVSSAFDDLLSGGAQNWVNSGTKQTKPVSANTNTLLQPSSVNSSNGWGNISTSTATTAASTKKNGLDDDIFGNVWK